MNYQSEERLYLVVVARGPSGRLSPSEGGLGSNSGGCDGYETRERCSTIMVIVLVCGRLSPALEVREGMGY